MKRYIFPYGFRLSLEEKKIVSFPAINLTLIKRDSKEEFSFLVLVDSGAEVSLFKSKYNFHSTNIQSI